MKLRTINGRVFIHVAGELGGIAILERSPWTGEYCYGLRTNPGEVPTRFRPAFQTTGRKTAKAAAKVAIAAYEGSAQS